MFPDEFRLSGIPALGEEHVDEYELQLDFDPAEEIALLTDMGLTRATLVEFGPGPGGFALAAARVAGHVVAVDPSPVMTAHIKRRAEELGLTNLSVATAGFLSYAHGGEPVDFVFTKNALHHLPDHWKAQALLRVRSLMKPGAVLRLRDLVYSFPPEEAEARLITWVEEWVSSGWSRDSLERHVRDEFSTYTWILEGLLTRAGFEILDRATSDNGVFAHYTCRAEA